MTRTQDGPQLHRWPPRNKQEGNEKGRRTETGVSKTHTHRYGVASVTMDDANEDRGCLSSVRTQDRNV